MHLTAGMETSIDGRRHDVATAHRVQCGINILHIAGVAEARLYLFKEGIAKAIIERVLADEPSRRRAVDPSNVQKSRR